jgi:predicted nucleic acid-binding protein
MTGAVFVDTNVLVYRLDTREPAKQAAAQRWLETLWELRRGRLSFQILQELYVTLTRRLDPALDVGAARSVVRSLLTWEPIVMSLGVVEAAWAVEDRFGLSWWDALVVASAQVGGCAYLLTEDLQHGQQLGTVQVISPFEVGPELLLG